MANPGPHPPSVRWYRAKIAALRPAAAHSGIRSPSVCRTYPRNPSSSARPTPSEGSRASASFGAAAESGATPVTFSQPRRGAYPTYIQENDVRIYAERKEPVMLSIRNARVRALAEVVMRETGAPSMTAAITQALEHEVERARQAIPLRQRIAALRRRAMETAVRSPAPVAPTEIDDLWEP